MENSLAVYESWKALIPTHFSDQSRVWIYQSSRMLYMQEALQVENLLEDFVANWKSHGAPVKGYANLLFGQFVVIMADETGVQVGGCSTDSSVRMIKEMENLFKVNMFDRMTLAFLRNNNSVQTIPVINKVAWLLGWPKFPKGLLLPCSDRSKG